MVGRAVVLVPADVQVWDLPHYGVRDGQANSASSNVEVCGRVTGVGKPSGHVFIGRESLKDPFWARTAADDLRQPINAPAQYTRYGSVWQRSQPPVPAAPLEETVAAPA